ncbi:hypothetical protein Tco_1084776 [Tanacetum coccineum]
MLMGEKSLHEGKSHSLSLPNVSSNSLGIGTRSSTLDFITSSDSFSRIELNPHPSDERVPGPSIVGLLEYSEADDRWNTAWVGQNRGTAFNGVVEELKKLTTSVAHVLPVSDVGGSTAKIVRVLGPQDFLVMLQQLFQQSQTDYVALSS